MLPAILMLASTLTPALALSVKLPALTMAKSAASTLTRPPADTITSPTAVIDPFPLLSKANDPFVCTVRPSGDAPTSRGDSTDTFPCGAASTTASLDRTVTLKLAEMSKRSAYSLSAALVPTTSDESIHTVALGADSTTDALECTLTSPVPTRSKREAMSTSPSAFAPSTHAASTISDPLGAENTISSFVWIRTSPPVLTMSS
mmetsp:Transcript_31259/g.52690  ORF Transcript_31259/g.52690 Transcript_31259/m.52690 type:complete len:203 (+) Transcript_31259:1132-1740(+)